MTTRECAELVARLFTVLNAQHLPDPAAAQVIYVQRLRRFDRSELARAIDLLLDSISGWDPKVPPIGTVLEAIETVRRQAAEHRRSGELDAVADTFASQWRAS